MTVIIRRVEKLEEPLDLMAAADRLPASWDGPHVGMRIVDGFATLQQMPSGIGGGLRSAWPKYLYEFGDLVAQAAQGELERTHNEQDRLRIAPSSAAIMYMERALSWPAKYLSAKHPPLCKAVNVVSYAHFSGADAGWAAKSFGGLANDWRRDHDRGCEIIAAGLNGARVVVF